jgi:hypothetical protein
MKLHPHLLMESHQNYISTRLSNIFEEFMFQIGALHTYSRIYKTKITIPNQNEFIEATKLFDSVQLSVGDYYTLSENDDKLQIIPFGVNIMLTGNFKTFKLYDETTLSFMRYFIYSCEDYMYAAYNKYNEIKTKMGSDSDEIVSIYFDDDANKPPNTSYYKKALILMNKKNVVVFSPQSYPDVMRIFDDDHNVQVVWDNNPYVRFILLSFFKYNIVQYYDSYFSMWAAYVSKYDTYKTVVVPDYLKKIRNEKINNMNVVYLD